LLNLIPWLELLQRRELRSAAMLVRKGMPWRRAEWSRCAGWEIGLERRLVPCPQLRRVLRPERAHRRPREHIWAGHSSRC